MESIFVNASSFMEIMLFTCSILTAVVFTCFMFMFLFANK